MRLLQVILDQLPDFMPITHITQEEGSTAISCSWRRGNHQLYLVVWEDGHCRWRYYNEEYPERIEVANTRYDITPVNVHVKYMLENFRQFP